MIISRISSISGIVGSRSRSAQAFKTFLHLPQYRLLGTITQLSYMLGRSYKVRASIKTVSILSCLGFEPMQIHVFTCFSRQ